MTHRRRQRQLEKRTYAETRARASLQLLAKGSLWQAVSAKQNVCLAKTTAEWKAARAVTKIHARLPQAIKMLFQAAESTVAFQAWARAVFPDTYLDAAIVEHLYDETELPFEKRATTKWFATASAFAATTTTLSTCYLFQESLADMAEIGRDVGCDRAHIDALIVKLERADDQSLLCSLAFQMVPSATTGLPFARPSAVDMAYRLARGIRNALEGHGLQANPVSSPVVRANQCFECAKTFHLFKRRVQCRYCHHRLCAGCHSRHMCPSATLDSLCDDDEADDEAEAELIAWMRFMAADDNRLDAASTIASDAIDQRKDDDASSSLQLSSIASPMSYATMSESAIDGLLTLDDSQSGQSFVNASSFGPSLDASVFESNVAMKNFALTIPEQHPTTTTFEGPSLVAVGSAWALQIDVEDAVVLALADLRASIGHAHFLVVSYSSNWSPEDIQMLLANHAPDVPYIGGTIARGICDDEAWIAKHKHSNEGLIALWGVHDPLGTYVVGHTEYDQLSARREVHRAMATSYLSTGATPVHLGFTLV
ncbi:hypothetical protein SPRG_10137 [Saprolegnia parasitica CBS 223.65]|uniref:FYVE-type domain-containing protein n=1 Tax=Saprolegnia parasitica (strain CBS 223.65) TaxID=695850 RepID=A0A067CDI1_SAPPC|nr:hypothetical protein SPRG_10137 [Saprolegnia parasitica CBS 223.65]KDO24606.1 hypothetical protein SPRG_10137 [Saprolegnia parasitica CBS 223.65]|eukprot:XP_012204674.1 hypothetical protein SPRG_10137 [Saprolegnia parasitica CBS 223.65]